MSVESPLLPVAAALIARYPYLDADPAAVAVWLGACAERTFAPGAVLCKEKTYGDACYIIVSGRVQVTRVDPRGVEHTLNVLDAPAIVGQLALIDSAVRHTTLLAMGPAPVEVRVLGRTLWQSLVASTTPAGQSVRRLMLSSLHEQLSTTHQRVTRIVSGGATLPQPERVVRLDADDFAPDALTDDLTDEQKIDVLNPYKR